MRKRKPVVKQLRKQARMAHQAVIVELNSATLCIVLIKVILKVVNLLKSRRRTHKYEENLSVIIVSH